MRPIVELESIGWWVFVINERKRLPMFRKQIIFNQKISQDEMEEAEKT